MQAAKWKIRTHGIRAASRRRDGLRMHVGERSGALAGKLLLSHESENHREGYAPCTDMCLLRYFQRSCEKYTRRIGGAESRSFFPVLREVPVQRGLAVTSDRPTRAYKRKRAEVIEVVPKGGIGEIAASPSCFRNEAKTQSVDRAIAIHCRKSYDYGHCASLNYRIAVMNLGIRRASRSGGPLTRLALRFR